MSPKAQQQADELEASQTMLGELAAELGRLRAGSVSPATGDAPGGGAMLRRSSASDTDDDGVDGFPKWDDVADDGTAVGVGIAVSSSTGTPTSHYAANVASAREIELTTELQAVTATLRTVQTAQVRYIRILLFLVDLCMPWLPPRLHIHAPYQAHLGVPLYR